MVETRGDCRSDSISEQVEAITTLVNAYAAAVRERNNLRAILRPRLEHPLYDDDGAERVCMFCHVGVRTHRTGGRPGDEARFPHEPDCPVLRRDELLGREEGRWTERRERMTEHAAPTP